MGVLIDLGGRSEAWFIHHDLWKTDWWRVVFWMVDYEIDIQLY